MNGLTTIHGSAALIGEAGILIRGASGSGKSTLLLDLLAADPKGTRLVADDRVIVSEANGRLLADVPAAIAGLVEMRGVGLLTRAYVAPIVIRLVVDLKPLESCWRLPEASEARSELEGVVLPRFCLPVGAGGGAQKVHAAMRHFFNPCR